MLFHKQQRNIYDYIGNGKLFVRIYEDNVAGKLSDERFAVMSSSYEEEQQTLKADTETLRQEIEVQNSRIRTWNCLSRRSISMRIWTN